MYCANCGKNMNDSDKYCATLRQRNYQPTCGGERAIR